MWRIHWLGSTFHFSDTKLWKGCLTYLILGFSPIKYTYIVSFSVSQITPNSQQFTIITHYFHSRHVSADVQLSCSSTPPVFHVSHSQTQIERIPLCRSCLLSWLKERAGELVDASYSFCIVLTWARSTIIPLVKENHMAKASTNVAGNYIFLPEPASKSQETRVEVKKKGQKYLLSNLNLCEY